MPEGDIYPRATQIGSADLIDKLPAAAQAKLRQLRAENEDARVALSALFDRRMDISDRLQRAQARLRELEQDRLGIDARPRAAAEVERIKAELAQTDEHRRRLTARMSELPDRIDRWLSEHGSARFEAVPAAKPKASGPIAIASAIDGARDQRAVLLADLKVVQDAPIPAALAKAEIAKQIDELAARAEPSVVLSNPPWIAWRNRHHAFDPIEFSCWLHRDALVAKFSADIDAQSDDESALTDVERTKREAALLVRIEEVERLEESLIEESEQQGAPVRRREDASPAVVLGVRAV
jgi:hypothetical protein